MAKDALKKAFTIPRESTAISKEYADLCAMAGDKNYRIDVLKAELQQLNTRLFELNQEHHASLAYHKNENRDADAKSSTVVELPATENTACSDPHQFNEQDALQ